MERKENFLSGIYGHSHVFCSSLALAIYINDLLILLPGCSYWPSILILLALIVGLNVLSVFLACERDQTGLNLLIDTLLPLELYSMLALFSGLHRAVLLQLAGAFFLFAWYLTVQRRYRLPRGPRRRRALLRRCGRILYNARAILTLCCLPLLIYLMYCSVFSDLGQVQNRICREEAERNGEVSIGQALYLLEEDRWRELDSDGKLGVLYAVLSFEMEESHLPYWPQLRVEELKARTLGTYNWRKRQITIQRDHLEHDPAMEVLDTLCHEFRHCYQEQLTALYQEVPRQYRELDVLDTARCFATEKAVQPEQDLEGYFASCFEQDARAYAAWRTEVYRSMMEHP